MVYPWIIQTNKAKHVQLEGNPDQVLCILANWQVTQQIATTWISLRKNAVNVAQQQDSMPMTTAANFKQLF